MMDIYQDLSPDERLRRLELAMDGMIRNEPAQHSESYQRHMRELQDEIDEARAAVEASMADEVPASARRRREAML